MNKIKLNKPIILLLVLALGITTLVGFAQSQNSENKPNDFDDNRNLIRVFRLVNSLNKEAEKQETKGFGKRAEMLRNYLQKKTGISNEAKLKLNELAANFQKESEKVNAEIKEVRKNQKNKPNDEALKSEFEKLRETRNKLFDSARESLKNELAKDDTEKVLKFLRDKVIGKSKKIDRSKLKKDFGKTQELNWFSNISYNEPSAFEDEIEGYSLIDYDPDSGEIFAMSVTQGTCEYINQDHEQDYGCRGAAVIAEIRNDLQEVLDESDSYDAGDSAIVEFYATEFEGQPLWSGQYCIYAQHGIETNNDYQWIYAESSECVDVEIVEPPTLEIMWNGNEITNTTQEAIVGQQIDLSVVVTGGGTPTNQQWTIAGEKVKDYIVTYTDPDSFTNAEVIELSSQDLSQNNVQFYWVDGGDGREIQVTTTVDGIPYTATANFNVKRPTAEMTATTSTVDLGDIPDPDGPNGQTVFALHFGSPEPVKQIV